MNTYEAEAAEKELNDALHASDNILNEMSLHEKADISNSLINDASLSNLRLFKSLTEHDKPIKELPVDENAHLMYPRTFEPRCQICASPPHLRDRIEHEYIRCGGNTNAVSRFVQIYWGARLAWSPIDTHMKMHCGLKYVSISGLAGLEGREEELARHKYRERDLVLTMILQQMDRILSIDTSRSPDLALKVSAQSTRLSDQLLRVAKERDEAATQSISIFEVLHSIYSQLVCEADRNVVKNKVRDLRERLAES